MKKDALSKQYCPECGANEVSHTYEVYTWTITCTRYNCKHTYIIFESERAKAQLLRLEKMSKLSRINAVNSERRKKIEKAIKKYSLVAI